MEKVYVKSRKVAPNTCPHCNETMDGLTGFGKESDDLIPCEDDLTICYYCGTALKFSGFRLVYATAEEWATVWEPCRMVAEKTNPKPIRYGP